MHSLWPTELEDVLLAKSADRSAGGKPESLAKHTWNVLARLADFMRLRPDLPRQLGQPALYHCLYWAAFLHDFGKSMPGFQGVLRGDVRLKEMWAGHRHEVFSLAFLDWIAGGMDDGQWLLTAAAIVAHHREADSIAELYPPIMPGESDYALEEQLARLPAAHVSALGQWFSRCGWAWAETLGFAELGVGEVEIDYQSNESFAPGATARIRLWLSRYSVFIRQLNRESDPLALRSLLALRGLLVNADHSASASAPPLPQLKISVPIILQSRRISEVSLYDHQWAAATTTGSVLLSAPTGSGKTEAALLWAARQAPTALRPPRLFYTLPYQASMNAMHARLSQSFGDAQVGMQHGRSLLAIYEFLMERQEDVRQASKQARWIRNLAQLNYPPVRVFSPYQMLKGVYRLKGYEAVLTDFHNALFIFDEIHAYEVQRLALILRTIAYLRRNFNARFFVMSATFPTLIKSWLGEALDAPVEIRAAPELFTRFQRHRLVLLPGEVTDPANLARITADARAGKTVLVVCNLVARAQAVFDALNMELASASVHVELLHGRFNIGDRLEKERMVRDFVSSGNTPSRPLLLVSTQVVEVSLDIDLDTIYSEPAPLEALVQRFGRINRRNRQSGLAPVHVFEKPDNGQVIYDPRLIAGTLQVLRRENGNPIPEHAIGGWLDEIYAGEVAQAWQVEFERVAADFDRDVLGTLRPFQASSFLKELFYEAFDGIDVLPAEHWDLYEERAKEAPLEAQKLLVSISYRRYHALRAARRVLTERGNWPVVVDTPYSSTLGLQYE